jgi:hypothetical protein
VTLQGLQACAHWMSVPPSQRQQSMQLPVASQRQHCLSCMVPVLQQAGAQLVVTPLQVTCPGSSVEQSRLTAVQVGVPLQLTLPLSHCTSQKALRLRPP